MIMQNSCDIVLPSIPDDSIQMIITSPPYNIGKSYEAKTSLEEYIIQQSSRISDFKRVLHPSGSIFWQVGNWIKDGEIVPLDSLFIPEFRKHGFKLRNRIIWHFEHGFHAKKRFSGRYEVILFLTKTDNYVFNLDNVRVPAKYPLKKHYKGPKRGQLSGNPKGKNPSDIWSIVCNDWDNEIWHIPNVKHNHPEKTIHPCQFPVELAERCILVATNEGDLVLDPYCGVGSSIIAAVKNNRKGIGIEINQEFCKIANSRLNSLKEGTLPLRTIDRGKIV